MCIACFLSIKNNRWGLGRRSLPKIVLFCARQAHAAHWLWYGAASPRRTTAIFCGGGAAAPAPPLYRVYLPKTKIVLFRQVAAASPPPPDGNKEILEGLRPSRPPC